MGTDMISGHGEEVASGDRFEFGNNWARYLATVDERAISTARVSLQDMLGTDSLQGRTFVDVGCGSGLFSLAARRLGAKVYSFDYDPQSVACTAELRRRYARADPEWVIAAGSVLDQGFLAGLGRFDVVYSWGVLHHTGAMWVGLENVFRLVEDGGLLFIAIYNDQGRASWVWRLVKRTYNRLPRRLRWLVSLPAFVRLWGPTTLRDLLRLRPNATWRQHSRSRGMSPWHDVVDWVGGYPFEVAKPEEIFDFYRAKGLVLQRLETCGGGRGCNEFVFVKPSGPP